MLPSVDALIAAGAPEDISAVGQQVPLFACLDIMMEDENDGTAMLPLFMDADEARAAMESVGAEEGQQRLQLECMSLTKAVTLLATVSETPAFQFVPPESSIRHIQAYLAETSRDNEGKLGLE